MPESAISPLYYGKDAGEPSGDLCTWDQVTANGPQLRNGKACPLTHAAFYCALGAAPDLAAALLHTLVTPSSNFIGHNVKLFPRVAACHAGTEPRPEGNQVTRWREGAGQLA